MLCLIVSITKLSFLLLYSGFVVFCFGFGCAESSLHHAGFSDWGTDFSGGTRVLGHVGSEAAGAWATLVVAHLLSCPVMCDILVLRSGIEPTPPALQGGFLNQ